MAKNGIPAQRHAIILKEAESLGVVRVDALSQLLEVSPMTIRRDLQELEAKGLIERTHGGAILTRHTGESLYSQKGQERASLKAMIGREAANLVKPGDTVFVNSGSTTFQVIQYIAMTEGVKVITNNVEAVMNLPDDCSAEVYLTGGYYRKISRCLIGDFARNMVEKIVANKVIIGTDGLSFKKGLTSPVQEEAALTRCMLAMTSGPCIVVADHTKIGRVTSFLTANLNDIDTLVTDSNLDKSFQNELKDLGVNLLLAGEN